VLLDGVVGEVHGPVLDVVQAEELARSADVALLVEVGLLTLVHRGQQQVAPDVELALVVQQRVVDVLLTYFCEYMR